MFSFLPVILFVNDFTGVPVNSMIRVACSARVLPPTFPFTVCILCSGALSAMYLPVSPIYWFPQSLQLIECIAPLWCWKGMGVFEASQAVFVGDSWFEKYFMLYGSRILQIRLESPSKSPCL